MCVHVRRIAIFSVGAHISNPNLMAHPAREASFTSKLLFGCCYCCLLVLWNYVCTNHYASAQAASSSRIVKAVPSHGRVGGGSAAILAAAVGDTPTAIVPRPAKRTTAVNALPAAATTSSEIHVSATTAAAAAVKDDRACPGRRPYHTLLTTQATTYQQWQSRIMYFHFDKQRKLDGPCTPMGGFTRLVASEGGAPDGLEVEMPSVFVKQYTTAEIARYGHFGVLNRPYSVVQWIDRGGMAKLAEPYVYIAETDHVLMRPLPNLAPPGKAAAFQFGYMHAGPSHQRVIDKHSPGTSWRKVQPVGPSPLIIEKASLGRLAPLWLNLSLSLKLDPEADMRFGWVLEMWGYSIAAASLGIEHEVLRNFQIEGGAGISARGRDAYIFHYTYGLEYTLQGWPQGPNQIGEWSLDKRHYGAAYPPRALQPPPERASDGTRWLLDAWNEASQNIPTWPETKALGTIGWRRVAGDGIAQSALAKKVAGTRWTWAGIPGFEFGADGHLVTPWGKGVWGALPTGIDYKDGGHCKASCLFADFSSALHNVRFDLDATPWTFLTYRLGDGANVQGVRV